MAYESGDLIDVMLTIDDTDSAVETLEQAKLLYKELGELISKVERGE